MESNTQLKTIVCDINGRVPTFGYPLINYSPKQNTVSLTDAQAWNHAIISDGVSALKDLSQENEFVMKSTTQLKIELTEKQDRVIQRNLHNATTK